MTYNDICGACLQPITPHDISLTLHQNGVIQYFHATCTTPDSRKDMNAYCRWACTCWHDYGKPFGDPPQITQVCCWCGNTRVVPRPRPVPEEHGPHAPKEAQP